MGHSSLQPIKTICPKCHDVVQRTTLMIVDISENPEILNEITKNSFRGVYCRRCGQGYYIDAPLLVLNIAKWPFLVFSPSVATSLEEDDAQFISLRGL